MNKVTSNIIKDNLGLMDNISTKSKHFKPPEIKDSCLEPFNMMIVGFTNCGKTYYLLELIEEEYLRHFEYIFLICPTYEHNRTYHNWKYEKDEKFIVICCEHDEVEEHLKYIVGFAKGTNSLVILDDCASGGFVKKRTSELVKLAFGGRHLGIGTIVIMQQFTSIAKPFRDNIHRLVVFFNPDGNDMNAILKKYLWNVSTSEKDDILNWLNSVTYGRLDISLRPPMSYTLVLKSTFEKC